MNKIVKRGEFSLIWDDGDSPINVQFSINTHRAKHMIKAFWKTYAKNIKKGVFRQGKIPLSMANRLGIDIDDLMGPSFSIFANKSFVEHCPKKVIMTDGHEVTKNKNGTYFVKFLAWFEPEVKINLEDVVLEFNLPKFDKDNYVEDRIRRFVSMNPYLRNKTTEKGDPLPAEDGDMVEVRIVAMVDGKLFSDGCEEATNIRVSKDIVQPLSLYKKLIGTKVGDVHSFKTSEVPDSFRHQIKGEMELEVTINKVYICEDAGIDDDMAITAGYKSLKQWKNALCDSAVRMAEAQYDMYRKQLVLAAITGVSEVGDFPEPWLNEKLKGINQDDSPEAIKQKINEVAKHSAILKYIGKLKEIEWDDDDKPREIRDESAYAQKVLQLLVKEASFTYVEQETKDTNRGDQKIAESQPSP